MEDFRPGMGGIFGDVAAVGLVTGLDNPPTETNNPAGSLLRRSQPAAYTKGQNLFLFGAIPQSILWASGVFLSVPVGPTQKTSVA